MDNKIKGVLLGVAGVILWFMPFSASENEFLGQVFYQQTSGSDIGGISYLLLVSLAVYAALSWYEQHPLRIIAAGVSIGIGLLFLIAAGSDVAWGLVALIGVAVLAILFAISDNKKSKTTSAT